MTNQPTGRAAAMDPAVPLGRGGPVGAVLAGGLGRRIGGAKATVALDHRPLISYPLEAACQALGDVAIVAKPDTELPDVRGARVWIEPPEPRHPLTGILHALGLAEGRPVLVCAGDMPLVTAQLIAAIAGTDPGTGCAVVATTRGELQPLLACYAPAALPRLAQAARNPTIPLREAVAGLDPRRFEVEDPDLLFNVNTPDDLLHAAVLLGRRRDAATRT